MSRIELKFYGSPNLTENELDFSKMFNRTLPCSILSERDEMLEHAIKHGIRPVNMEEAKEDEEMKEDLEENKEDSVQM